MLNKDEPHFGAPDASANPVVVVDDEDPMKQPVQPEDN